MTNEILIRIAPTPNPNAYKFILDKPVLTSGKATYQSLEEAKYNPLALSLISLIGVKQVHFFANVITITHALDADFDVLKEQIVSVIKTRMVIHNPDQTPQEEKKIARNDLSPELKQIEEILDETVRPGLQGDGGDIEILSYDDDKLYVRYQGACGTCPSSTEGTLMAIEGILQDRFNPNLQVVIVPYE